METDKRTQDVLGAIDPDVRKRVAGAAFEILSGMLSKILSIGVKVSLLAETEEEAVRLMKKLEAVVSEMGTAAGLEEKPDSDPTKPEITTAEYIEQMTREAWGEAHRWIDQKKTAVKEGKFDVNSWAKERLDFIESDKEIDRSASVLADLGKQFKDIKAKKQGT